MKIHRLLSVMKVISWGQAQIRQDSKSKAGKSGCLHVKIHKTTRTSSGLEEFKLLKPALPLLQKGGPDKILPQVVERSQTALRMCLAVSFYGFDMHVPTTIKNVSSFSARTPGS